MFGFSGTLSTSHIWNALTGSGHCSTPVPPPYSNTEAGQVKRLIEVDKTLQYGGPGGFAVQVFGGRSRLAALSGMLSDLRACGIDCIVCSRSFVGVLRKLLDQAGLLKLTINVTVFESFGASNLLQKDAPRNSAAGKCL